MGLSFHPVVTRCSTCRERYTEGAAGWQTPLGIGPITVLCPSCIGKAAA